MKIAYILNLSGNVFSVTCAMNVGFRLTSEKESPVLMKNFTEI